MIKFKTYLAEAETRKPVVFAFGRMNPPTSGHQVLVDKVHELAKRYGAHHEVVLSHSQDAKKNPLSAEEKLKHARRAFPKTNISVASSEKPTFVHHLKRLHAAGYTDLHMVAGSDRVKDYHDIVHKYNGKPDHWNFKHIQVHSAGERDPDAEGATGMSASKMRAHAASGNIGDFKKGAPSSMSDKHSSEMYHAVRRGMGVK